MFIASYPQTEQTKQRKRERKNNGKENGREKGRTFPMAVEKSTFPRYASLYTWALMGQKVKEAGLLVLSLDKITHIGHLMLKTEPTMLCLRTKKALTDCISVPVEKSRLCQEQPTVAPR